MSYVNIEIYAGDFEYRLIADTAKNGTHTIKLPKPLTGFSDDAEISFVVADGSISVADSDINFRIGTEFTPPCYLEIEAGTAQSLIRVVLTDCKDGAQIYDIRETDNITVGVSLKETIAYTLEGRASINDNVYYTIKKNGSDAFIEPSSPLPIIFLNSKLIKTAAPLKYGAHISVLGLSVIYLGDSIAVYNPCGLVTTRLPAADDSALPEAAPREEIVFKRVARIYSGVRKKKFTVEQPESPAAEEKLPAALVIGPSITMGISMLASVGMSIMNSGNNTASIIMAASMLAGTALWPNLMRAYTKKAKIAKESERQRRYTAYLNGIESELEENAVKNLNALQFAAASAGDITGWIENKMLRRIWERSVSDDDFLKVRIGTGKIANPSEIGFPHTTYLNKDDILLQKSEEIRKKYKYLSGAPVTIDMKQTNSVGIIGMNVLVRFTAINIALQLAALHDSSELKMAFFYSGAHSKDFEWIKKLPHCWNEYMTFRYIAESQSESAVVVR
jgi:S-DNA-T family DNA segregation ATPase FtsK/SpoIIIE